MLNDAAIRESNPTRIVYVTSNKWSSFHTVSDVELPADKNIALALHFYEPLIFTHQRAPWVGFKNDLPKALDTASYLSLTQQ